MCTDLSARLGKGAHRFNRKKRWVSSYWHNGVPSGWNNVFHLDEASGFNMLKLIRILIFRVYRQL